MNRDISGQPEDNHRLSGSPQGQTGTLPPSEPSPTTEVNSSAMSQQGNTLPMGHPAPAPPVLTYDEMLKIANGVGNMTLAHEIAVDNKFRFEEGQLPENSVEAQVKKVMHRAFWDALQDKLDRTPPDYSHALVLLQEVKEKLIAILLPEQHSQLKSEICAVLDMDLIRQQIDKEALDFMHYAKFIISMMARLCAPVRDEEIAALLKLKEIVPLYKEIFHILDLMRIDMANFHLEQVRPYIQQQSIDYEKLKFQDLLQTLRAKGQDGLQNTRVWLGYSYQLLFNAMQFSQQAQTMNQTNPTVISPAEVLNRAYLEIFNFDHNTIYPETVLMDKDRLISLQEDMDWLCLTAAILLVTYSTVGDAISGIAGFQQKLKKAIRIIMPSTSDSNISDQIVNISEHLNTEVDRCLVKHGYSSLDSETQQLLKGQIRAVASMHNPVHKLMRERVMNFLNSVLSQPQQKDRQLPAGCTCVADELANVTSTFLHLVSHNRAVYGNIYAEIITHILGIKGPTSNPQMTAGPVATAVATMGPGIRMSHTGGVVDHVLGAHMIPHTDQGRVRFGYMDPMMQSGLMNPMDQSHLMQMGQPHPMQMGQPHPMQMGQPMQMSQPHPMQMGQPHPKQMGHPNPMQMGHPSPMQMGHPNPMQMGHPSPMQMGHPNPMQMDQSNPMQMGQLNPMQMGQSNPMQMGQSNLMGHGTQTGFNPPQGSPPGGNSPGGNSPGSPHPP